MISYVPPVRKSRWFKYHFGSLRILLSCEHTIRSWNWASAFECFFPTSPAAYLSLLNWLSQLAGYHCSKYHFCHAGKELSKGLILIFCWKAGAKNRNARGSNSSLSSNEEQTMAQRAHKPFPFYTPPSSVIG